MPHSWFPVPGFLLQHGEDALREDFMMVDQAADWCSLEPRCRGFTVSAEVHDDRLLWVRFSAGAGHVLSADWLTYLKEPAASHHYSFTPGYLLPPEGGAPLHQEWAGFASAHAFCDAEPRCAGFSLALPEAGAPPTPVAWVSYHDARAATVVYNEHQISYVRGARLAAADGAAASGGAADADERAALFELQPGYLGGAGGAPLRQARVTLAAARRWCAARAACAGFSVPSAAAAPPSAAAPLAVTWHGWGGAALTLAPGWVSHVRAGHARAGRYVLQPGYLRAAAELADADVPRGVPLSIHEARVWCERRPGCAGFTLNVAVPPSTIGARADADNARAAVSFHASDAVAAYAPAAAGWVSYTKASGPLQGSAAGTSLVRLGAPLSWLVQPGFILRHVEEAPPHGAAAHDQMLRQDEQVALVDLLAWCGAAPGCEGFTFARPAPDRPPSDRLARAACYCCGAQVRTSAAQLSLTKWAPPARDDEPGTEGGEPPPRGPQGGHAAAGSTAGARRGRASAAALHDSLQALAEAGGADAEAGFGAPPITAADGGGEGWSEAPYQPQLGWVTGGRELREGFMSTAQATRWCARHAACRGFTTRAPEPGGPIASVTYVQFSAGNDVVHDPSWYSWTKPGAGQDDQDDDKEEL